MIEDRLKPSGPSRFIAHDFLRNERARKRILTCDTAGDGEAGEVDRSSDESESVLCVLLVDADRSRVSASTASRLTLSCE